MEPVLRKNSQGDVGNRDISCVEKGKSQNDATFLRGQWLDHEISP